MNIKNKITLFILMFVLKNCSRCRVSDENSCFKLLRTLDFMLLYYYYYTLQYFYYFFYLMSFKCLTIRIIPVSCNATILIQCVISEMGNIPSKIASLDMWVYVFDDYYRITFVIESFCAISCRCFVFISA